MRHTALLMAPGIFRIVLLQRGERRYVWSVVYTLPGVRVGTCQDSHAGARPKNS